MRSISLPQSFHSRPSTSAFVYAEPPDPGNQTRGLRARSACWRALDDTHFRSAEEHAWPPPQGSNARKAHGGRPSSPARLSLSFVCATYSVVDDPILRGCCVCPHTMDRRLLAEVSPHRGCWFVGPFSQSPQHRSLAFAAAGPTSHRPLWPAWLVGFHLICRRHSRLATK